MSGEGTLIDPSIVYFTFSRIRPKFSCGRTVAETLDQIRSGEISVASLPRISLLFDGANYFSLNNRRLFVFKTLRAEGLVDKVPVRIKSVPSTKRMQSKYSVDKCALQAKLMPQQQQGKADDGNGDEEEDEQEEDGDDVAEGSTETAAPAGASRSISCQDFSRDENPVPVDAKKHSDAPRPQGKQQPLPPQKAKHVKEDAGNRRGVTSLEDELAALHSKLATNDDDSDSDDGRRRQHGNNNKSRKRK